MTVPNFIYIGTGKAGTTWLHNILLKHDAIYVTPVKETNFFDLNYERGLSWYKNFFKDAPKNHIVGEISHRYIHNSYVANRIYKNLGDIKIIVGLRNPVDYFVSDYLFAKRNGRFNKDLKEWADNRFIWESLNYKAMLEPYIDIFGIENIFIYKFDDLENSPQFLIDNISNFLSTKSYQLKSDDYKKVNAAAQPRIRIVASTVNRISKFLKKGGQKLIAMVKRNKIIKSILYKDLADKPVLSDELKSRIFDYSLDDVEWVDEKFQLNAKNTWYLRN